jgi:hypothetical protein
MQMKIAAGAVSKTCATLPAWAIKPDCIAAWNVTGILSLFSSGWQGGARCGVGGFELRRGPVEL